MRNTPSRISPETYPIAATATAPAYPYYPQTVGAEPESHSQPESTAQQVLFAIPASDPRVIAFDSLTTPAQRESIRVRAAEIPRPAPLKTEKIEAPRPRARANARISTDQHRLDFLGQQQVLAAPQSSIICDAPVAPPSLRVRAMLIDAMLVALGCCLGAALFKLLGGQFSVDKYLAPFVLMAIATVPLAYKLLWTFAGRDSVGMHTVGLQLVDFDGNRPSQARRGLRFFGMLLSFLAAGLGVIWVFVDEDALTWHDHISGTFPTIISRD